MVGSEALAHRRVRLFLNGFNPDGDGEPECVRDGKHAVGRADHGLLHGEERVEKAQGDLIQEIVQTRDRHGEHGVGVGVDLLRRHVQVRHGLGGDGLEHVVDGTREDRDERGRGVLGRANCRVEAVVDPSVIWGIKKKF